MVKYLYEWSIGNYPELFWNYFIHLGDYGQKDGLPFLDKDLLFCIDAVRMRVSLLINYNKLVFSFFLMIIWVFYLGNQWRSCAETKGLNDPRELPGLGDPSNSSARL